jgi:hypothetical protein
MHEIRVTLPPDCVSEAASLAHAAGIDRVGLADVFVHGPNLRRQILSVETSNGKSQEIRGSVSELFPPLSGGLRAHVAGGAVDSGW